MPTANSIASKDADELIDDTREFVRKSPGVALAGAAIVGFALARLGRAEEGRAIELEALWNELGSRHRVKLLCSYPLDAVSGRNQPHASRLRDSHTHAVPS